MKKDLKERLFEYYGIDENDYQKLIADSDIDSFAEGHHFDHMEEAVEMVKSAVKNLKRIAIYGDYDADGIMGASILKKMFMYIHYPVDYYIPSRYIDGYGLTLKYAKEAVERGVGLLICVDNGVSAFEGIEYLHENGVEVLVLDHHTIQDTLPMADYIIHPTYSHFGEIASSGAFTAFMFSREFLGYTDKYLATLASISLISDMMPLLSYNRRLLKATIANYQYGEFLPIDLLKENEPFNENTIGMKIAPKINAIGRMIETDEINKVVEFFTSDDKDVVLNYISWINDTNETRKEASKEAAEKVKSISKDDAGIAIICDVKEGLLGLVANNLCTKFHVPTIVFAKEMGGDTLKGSARAPQGYNIMDIFNELSDLTLANGGHALAGGCSINESDFEEFKRRFNECIKAHPIAPYEEKTVQLGLTEINFDNYELIKTFSPFGENWPSPLFEVDHILTGSLMYSRTNEHIMSYIGQGVKLVGFNFSKDYISQFGFIDIFGRMKTSVYRGLTSLEFGIKEVKESKK
ncbi:MAG: DHH family phosphoesterase [Bacilli bacterium]|nr:DHH family phosphoesterase [Bacilli bacterium]